VTRDLGTNSPEQTAKIEKIVAALSAEAQLKSQLAADTRDASLIAEGRNLIQNDVKCTDCHQFHKPDEDATAPDLTGYGSRRWLIGFISDPAHVNYYGKRNDRMPRFGADQVLSTPEIELIADWLRGTWYEPGVAEAAH
jgi:ubiquinol-cytochrome c reductase cytochrome b subunit